METSSISIEFAIIVLLILLNGLFAMAEMSIVSSRKTKLERLARSGSTGAQTALLLSKDPTLMLSTVQVGITLISILTGVFGGTGLANALSPYMSRWFPLLAPYTYSITLLVVVAVITYLTLLVGELAPKRIALNRPEAIASWVAGPIRLFSTLTRPVVIFLTLSTNWFLKLLGIRNNPEEPVTEEEIKILLEQGTLAGTFEKEETQIVDRVFRLNDLRANNIMTPRTQMDWLDLEQPAESLLDIIKDNPYARFPVGMGSLDDFRGMVYTNDLLAAQLRGEVFIVEKYLQKPVYIPESMKIIKMVDKLRNSVSHEAIVLDEFGGVAGLVTLQDVMDELLGHMPLGEEDNEEEPKILPRTETTWLVDGLVPIEEFKDFFQIEMLPGEAKDSFQTVGGFVVDFLGHIPIATEHFSWQHFVFEVMDMDRLRVDKIMVTRLPLPEEPVSPS